MQYNGWRKYFVATWAFVETFLFGGLIYGWVPVVYIFKQQGIYADLCPSNSTTSNANSSFTYDLAGTGNVTSLPLMLITTRYEKQPRETCKPQDQKFALAFTIGSALFCAGSAVFGYINFKFGTRVTRVISMYVYFTFKKKLTTTLY